MQVKVISGDRRDYGTSQPVINYRLMIVTGPRCFGFISQKTYKTEQSAYAAAKKVESNIIFSSKYTEEKETFR